MRNKREYIRHAVVLMLAVAGLTICAAPLLAQAATLRANGKIAFTSDRDGNREIYVMNADGTNQVRLTNNSVVDDHPTWSPDGSKIAFVSERTSGGFAIFVMNGDGTNKSEVTPISSDIMLEGWSMNWSPDGSRLVFQDKTAPSVFRSDLFIVNINGNNRHVLVNDSLDERQPAWSPDGSRILFTREGSNHSPFYTVRPDGSDLRALPHFDRAFDWEWDYAPSWSPTGDKIAFTILDWANFNSIGLANADGSNRQWFYDGNVSPEGNPDKPQWSPDGSKIVFHFNGDSGAQIYVKNVDGSGLTRLTNLPGNNFKPSWQSIAPAACPNPIDCAEFFVRQHYLDFLNRQPDAAGLAFWVGEINSCGEDAQCIEVKRIHGSAAFFLSIEFQETGYFAYRLYKSAYGNLPNAPVPITLSEFLSDSQQIGQGVIVNQAGWDQVLENNKQAFASDFVQRSRFTSAFPTSTSPAEFVDSLFANAGVTPTSTERTAAINEFGSASTTSDAAARARALRLVAENPLLVHQEFNRAFVLMQYFGYLRRNPNDAPEPGLNFDGYNFWLNKLDQFDGDYIGAEMVKAFIASTEYRQRF